MLCLTKGQNTMKNKQKSVSGIKNKPEIKFIKKPNYHNEEVLIHCINSEPHSLLFDKKFISYDEKTVVNLCEDLEANFDYLIALLEHSKNQESLSRQITVANSLVWASLFHLHEEFVPEKYKQEDSKN